jgi:hypothetical protein
LNEKKRLIGKRLREMIFLKGKGRRSLEKKLSGSKIFFYEDVELNFIQIKIICTNQISLKQKDFEVDG